MNLPHCQTLIELLQLRAETQPDRMAFGFLRDGEQPGAQLSFQDLARDSATIANRLRRLAPPGERALLLLPAGLEFVTAFFGCLAAGIIAVPAPAPHPARLSRSMPRLQAIAADAEPGIVIVEAALRDAAKDLMDACPALRTARWVTLDECADGQEALPENGDLNEKTTALLQYTSGSTTRPRGVIVTHGNLLSNLAAIEQRVVNDSLSVGVSWLPPFHDMGLIGGILQPVFGGYPGWLMSPAAFLQRPIRWLEAISHLKSTFSGGPNFAYDLCVRRTTPEQRATLNLRAWRYAFNGSEPVRERTMTAFADAFDVAGFQPEAWRPVYGLAEATLMVSCGGRHYTRFARRIEKKAGARHPGLEAPNALRCSSAVSCGPPAMDTDVRVVHPTRRTVCKNGRTGEIWVCGPGVAQGYWRDSKATLHAFGARLAGSDDGPFLRTGDLGFVEDGEVYITGRLKDLIIIRGRKLYPQDIEFTVEQSHPAIRANGCAAFTVPFAEEESVVVAVEVDARVLRAMNGNFSAGKVGEEISASIRQMLVETCEVAPAAVLVLPPGALPRTTSGKLRRGACRQHYLGDSFPALTEASQQVIALKIPP